MLPAKTIIEIQKTIDLLKSWGLFDELTNNEKHTIVMHLRDIAHASQLDNYSAFQDLLHKQKGLIDNILPVI